MTILFAYQSDVGLKRNQNEDYIWTDKQTGLFIVADGMGGHEAGEVASELAATTIGELITDQLEANTEPISAETIQSLIIRAIEIANELVFKKGQEAAQVRPMGTTIVVALVQPALAYISHVGDARAYLIRGATLMRLTKDDTWGAQLETLDASSQEKLQSRKLDSILTKTVGQGSSLEPSFVEVNIAPEDWLLLCSDGLWNMVDDEQILTAFQEPDVTPTAVVKGLVAAANAAGGKDNISIVAIKYLP